MTKNSLKNALLAILYIVVVVLVMSYGQNITNNGNSIFVPIAMLSLFTLSVAVMGYLFFYEPAELYLNNNKKGAVQLFLQTVAIFGVITVILFALIFSGVIH